MMLSFFFVDVPADEFVFKLLALFENGPIPRGIVKIQEGVDLLLPLALARFEFLLILCFLLSKPLGVHSIILIVELKQREEALAEVLAVDLHEVALAVHEDPTQLCPQDLQLLLVVDFEFLLLLGRHRVGSGLQLRILLILDRVDLLRVVLEVQEHIVYYIEQDVEAVLLRWVQRRGLRLRRVH